MIDVTSTMLETKCVDDKFEMLETDSNIETFGAIANFRIFFLD